jgi:hypothetical protein
VEAAAHGRVSYAKPLEGVCNGEPHIVLLSIFMRCTVIISMIGTMRGVYRRAGSKRRIKEQLTLDSERVRYSLVKCAT